jgi:glutathione S-transferase
MHSDGEAVAATIDGRDGSWSLPLTPLTTTSTEAYYPGDSPPNDTLAAAGRLIDNHKNVARFAARATGAGARRGVSAELSDPYAECDESAVHAVDSALRHVAHALLVGVDAKDVGEHALKVRSDT